MPGTTVTPWDDFVALEKRVKALEQGGSTPIPPEPPVDYQLIVTQPRDGASATGKVQFSGTAPKMLNVEVWDYNQKKLLQTPVNPDGTWSGDVDTKKLSNGQQAITVWAWDAPPGGTPLHSSSFPMTLQVQNQGGGGQVGTRPFLLGMYRGGGCTTGPYPGWLGYSPDFTLNGSFQTHSAGGGLWPASQTYPIVFDIDGGQYDMTYEDIAAGRHDAHLNNTLDYIQVMADKIYAFRIDREFNLYTNWLHTTPNEYKVAMNRWCDIIRGRFPLAKIIWNPNAINGGDLSQYVPEKCDIIGVDAYANPTWNNTAEVLMGNPGQAGTLLWWTEIALNHAKPMAMPEWGDDYGDGRFIDSVLGWAFTAHNNVVLLAYWDSTDGEPANLRGASYDAFKRQLAGVQYQGQYWQHKPTDSSIPGF